MRKQFSAKTNPVFDSKKFFLCTSSVAMAERRRTGYSIQRKILDEGAVDEMAEKSDSKPSLCEKVKKSMR